MTIPKDHWPVYRAHWIESRAGDPGQLRASMLQLYETELLFGALLLGTIVALYTSNAVSDAQLDDFMNYRVATRGFWVVLMGTFACILSTLQLLLAYLAMMLLFPISEANIYTFLRMESTRRTLHMPNVVFVTTFQSTLVAFILILIDRLDGSYLACAIVLVPTFTMIIGISPQFGYSLNVSLLGGFYAPYPVMPETEVAGLSGNELEDRIVEPILQYRKKHGMADPPADPTFYAADRAGMAFRDICSSGSSHLFHIVSAFERKRPSL